MKQCKQCKQILNHTEYYKNLTKKDKLNTICKVCSKINNKKYKTSEEGKIKSKKYREDNKEKIKEQSVLNYQQNKEKIHQYHKEHYIKYNYQKQWKENNKHKVNENNKERYKIDPQYKLKFNISNRIRNALYASFTRKDNKTPELIGCSINELKIYLEQLFKPEMTWGNHGTVWEIDHIKPCSSFDLTQLEEQQKCFHYTNLQPLFKTTQIADELGYGEIGNRNKSSKIF